MPDVILGTDLETAWRAWTLIETTGWRFLPNAGGLLEQDEALLNDVLTISTINERLRKQEKGDG